jgi:hypothetical protein
MVEELARLILQREGARLDLLEARLSRDSAARRRDAVADDPAATQDAWVSFTARQQEMDRADDRLHSASSAVIDLLLRRHHVRHTAHLLDRAHRCRRSAQGIMENVASARFATRELAMHQMQIADNLNALAKDLERKAALDLGVRDSGAELAANCAACGQPVRLGGVPPERIRHEPATPGPARTTPASRPTGP